jgi:hypothetical protein
MSDIGARLNHSKGKLRANLIFEKNPSEEKSDEQDMQEKTKMKTVELPAHKSVADVASLFAKELDAFRSSDSTFTASSMQIECMREILSLDKSLLLQKRG